MCTATLHFLTYGITMIVACVHIRVMLKHCLKYIYVYRILLFVRGEKVSWFVRITS